MAIPGYLWIQDEQANDVKGPVKIKGREGSVEVTGLTHEIYIPADHDTGALTGTRKHLPFIVTKTFDSTSPFLHDACCHGKNLNEVKISWYRITKSGAQEEYYRHTLSNVKVVAIAPMVDDVKDKSKEHYGHREQVHFRYDAIKWEYLDGNIAAQDSWTELS